MHRCYNLNIIIGSRIRNTLLYNVLYINFNKSFSYLCLNNYLNGI